MKYLTQREADAMQFLIKRNNKSEARKAIETLGVGESILLEVGIDGNSLGNFSTIISIVRGQNSKKQFLRKTLADKSGCVVTRVA